MIRRILTVAMLTLGTGAASAQDNTVRMVIPASQQEEQVRLNVSMNFFVPGPAGLNEPGMQAQERARRTIYEMSVRECAVLRETIASSCRMESMNVNINRHQGSQPEGFTVGANVGFRVTLKR